MAETIKENVISSSPFSLAGRTVLVTGASSGIGRAAAVQISRMGGRVAALGRSAEKLDETLALLEGEGHRRCCVDLANIDGLESGLADLAENAENMKEMFPLHGLVHSAGVSEMTLLRDVNFKSVENMLRLNWMAFFALCKFACRRGRYGDGMSVVVIASMAALRGQTGMSFYAGSKGAVLASVPALAAEYAPRGIRFNAVSPCPVNTPMQRQAVDKIGEDWYRREVLEKVKLGPLEPEDIADAVVFLLSKASRRITGTNMIVDSGWSLM